MNSQDIPNKTFGAQFAMNNPVITPRVTWLPLYKEQLHRFSEMQVEKTVRQMSHSSLNPQQLDVQCLAHIEQQAYRPQRRVLAGPLWSGRFCFVTCEGATFRRENKHWVRCHSPRWDQAETMVKSLFFFPQPDSDYIFNIEKILQLGLLWCFTGKPPISRRHFLRLLSWSSVYFSRLELARRCYTGITSQAVVHGGTYLHHPIVTVHNQIPAKDGSTP